MSNHTEIVKHIRKFLATAGERERFSREQIADALSLEGITPNEISAAITHMVQKELICSQRVAGIPHYARASAFVSRQITPLFMGTPDWVVETFEGRLVCWCPSAFDARIIADALNRS